MLCITISSNAQKTIQGNQSQEPRQKDREVVNEDPEKIDSINITTYSLSNLNVQDTFKTKGLTKYFQQYDPARNRDFEYGNLGNMGSAAYPLVLDLHTQIGYTLGINQYKLYQKTEDDIKFFNQKSPVSELYFSGGESQADLRVKALFSKNFANDVNWVIDYDRISQAGIYINQKVKQTSFLTGIAYTPKKSNLSLFVNYLINASVEKINGGVIDPSLISQISLRKNYPVHLSDAEDRLQNQGIFLNAFYDLEKDSSNSEFKTSVQYEMAYFNEFFRFTDPSISNDSLYYKNFYLGDRGLRHYVNQRRIRNSVFFNNSFKEYYNFKTGISYDYNFLNLSSQSRAINDVYLRFNGTINLKKKLIINGDVYYGLLNVANQFGIDAKAQLSLTKQQGFNFGFKSSRMRASYIQEELILNEEVFYNKDQNKIFFQSLSAEYYNNKLHFKIGGKLQNILNYIYFDDSGDPISHDKIYNVSLLYFGNDIKYKSLMIENFLFIQNQSEILTNLPKAFTKNSVSFYGNVFKKKMLLKAGFDFRYIINEYLPYYSPITGQFELNTSTTNKAYPLIDGRISFKVSSFTTFAKYENLTSFFSDQGEFMVLNYPQFDARFRFGIQWNLWN